MIKKAGTHNGIFHGDEVVGYVILKELFGDFELIRTRDPKLLETCDIVFDVGGGEFDHHTNDKEYRKNEIPYAAAGLIWRKFGKKLIRKKGINNEEVVHKIFIYMDKNFIQGVDALDNGKNYSPAYPVMDLSKVISQFNPSWDSNDNIETQFFKAADFTRTVFLNLLEAQISVANAGTLIEQALANREAKELLVLDSSCPWKQTLLDLDKDEEVLFVVFPDMNDGYRIQVIPRKVDTFDARKDLPVSWAGLEDTELNELLGIQDAIFAHPGRFIAGARSKESIMKMAELAVAEPC